MRSGGLSIQYLSVSDDHLLLLLQSGIACWSARSGNLSSRNARGQHHPLDDAHLHPHRGGALCGGGAPGFISRRV